MITASSVASSDASLEVEIRGQISRFVLTESSVSLHSPKSIFQDATVVIPLSSVDSIFIGWRRHRALLITGIILILVGLSGQKGSGAVLVIGLVCLTLFWFLRPARFYIRSVRESLDGQPVSESAARK
jgi:hypothetical protein